MTYINGKWKMYEDGSIAQLRPKLLIADWCRLGDCLTIWNGKNVQKIDGSILQEIWQGEQKRQKKVAALAKSPSKSRSNT